VTADIEIIADAIRAAALCVVCLARKADAAPFGVIGALASIGQRAKVATDRARCDGCSLDAVVYRIR
jgi:hypothetical protein